MTIQTVTTQHETPMHIELPNSVPIMTIIRFAADNGLVVRHVGANALRLIPHETPTGATTRKRSNS